MKPRHRSLLLKSNLSRLPLWNRLQQMMFLIGGKRKKLLLEIVLIFVDAVWLSRVLDPHNFGIVDLSSVAFNLVLLSSRRHHFGKCFLLGCQLVDGLRTQLRMCLERDRRTKSLIGVQRMNAANVLLQLRLKP